MNDLETVRQILDLLFRAEEKARHMEDRKRSADIYAELAKVTSEIVRHMDQIKRWI